MRGSSFTKEIKEKIMHRHRCSCGKNHHPEFGTQAEFDAQKAFTDLSLKFQSLSQVLSRYMSEAGLDRETRIRNALNMAATVTGIDGGMLTIDHPECCLVGHRLREENGEVAFNWFCTGVLIH